MKKFPFPHIQRDKPAPFFQLPSSLEKLISPSDYYGRRNLVLLFLPGLEHLKCRTALENFAAYRQEYEEKAAQVLVIFSGPTAKAALEEGQAYPFPLLADPDGSVTQAYAALLPFPVGEEPMVFVLDRYRGSVVAFVGPELDKPAIHQEILEWLAFIEIQCPECGVPEWPVET